MMNSRRERVLCVFLFSLGSFVVAVVFVIVARAVYWRESLQVVSVAYSATQYVSGYAQITVTNRSSRAIRYEGYSPAMPIGAFGLWENGGWQCKAVSYCGNGVSTWVLPKGGVTTFKVWPPEPSFAWRLGILSRARRDWARYLP